MIQNRLFSSIFFKKAILASLFVFISSDIVAQQTVVRYLSGRDKDRTVPWEFYLNSGRKSGRWTKIPVPSNWELQGFGTYNYGHDKLKPLEQGIYRHEFSNVDTTGKSVFIVFEGVMTDASVKINGQLAGPVHHGGFYRFKYDITKLINARGINLLEVTVDKTSSIPSVNQAERSGDFWVFGGIYRPVYLEITPEKSIDRIAVDAKADGKFQAEIHTRRLRGGEIIEAQIQKLNGKKVGPVFSEKVIAGQDMILINSSVKNPLLWNAESPNLYQVLVTIKQGKKIIHQIRQKFGFRTIELRKNDGLYVNGVKIMLKGVNRHSFWPESGRTLSHQLHLLDVSLMKEMNMNAVRMSHYPPDQDFLDVCDSAGLYVLDELTGWQAKYDTIVGRKLVKELVVRDVNHPSIIFWDNGNEGGWNRALDGDYDLFDPQKRVVLHPWEKFNGTDTKHYPDYNYMLNAANSGKEVFFPTEFMHGLYDGGAGAGLDDFWKQMVRHPHGAGGFIWVFSDEAVARTDSGGVLDADGLHAPDGILGPHREKEASFYSIREIWSPIYVEPEPINTSFDGKIRIENRYSFTNLSQCSFKWSLLNFPGPEQSATENIVKATGYVKGLSLKPGESALLDLGLPTSWTNHQALSLTAFGPDNKPVASWSWKIQQPSPMTVAGAGRSGSGITVVDTSEILEVRCDNVSYFFDKTNGYIKGVLKAETSISLSDGPILAGAEIKLTKFRHQIYNDSCIVEAEYLGAASLKVRWTLASGSAAKMEYTYVMQGESDFAGITFSYPEKKITGMKWLGRGPYRVWKNRLKGLDLGVWHKKYNNAVTGETPDYPEFKGYHAELSWVVVENSESPFTVYVPDEQIYFQMLQPDKPKIPLKGNNVDPAFPKGTFGFLQGISAIGTKFQAASSMGPQSQKNTATGKPVSGTLWFKF